jgi:hypothetical protein
MCFLMDQTRVKIQSLHLKTTKMHYTDPLLLVSCRLGPANDYSTWRTVLAYPAFLLYLVYAVVLCYYTKFLNSCEMSISLIFFAAELLKTFESMEICAIKGGQIVKWRGAQ